MMKRGFALMLALLLSISTCAAGLAEGEALHLFLDIPFDVSISEFAQRVEEATGVQNGSIDSVGSYAVPELPYLGYPMRLYADQHHPGIARVLLECIHSDRPTTEAAFWEAARPELEQFMDMEAQLTALWGEPDKRWFTIGPVTPQYMLADGEWALEPLMRIGQENEGSLAVYSTWNNVSLSVMLSRLGLTNRRYPVVQRIQLAYHDKPLSHSAVPEVYAFPSEAS